MQDSNSMAAQPSPQSSVFSSVNRQRASPDLDFSTENHLEHLTSKSMRALAASPDPESMRFILENSTPDFVASTDEGGFQARSMDIHEALALMAAKTKLHGVWLSKILSVTADLHNERTSAVVWLHYSTRANNQNIHRELVMRFEWRYIDAEQKWMCNAADYIRGPGLNALDFPMPEGDMEAGVPGQDGNKTAGR
jgi:hypothetical protein